MSCPASKRGVISRCFFGRLFFGQAVAIDHVVNRSKADLESFCRAASVALACLEGVDEAGFGERFDAACAAFKIILF